jgi:hypothetical protein
MKLGNVALVAALAIAACKAADSRSAAVAEMEAARDTVSATTAPSPAAPRMKDGTSLEPDRPADNRKVIRTGRIDLVVEPASNANHAATWDAARAQIDALVNSAGGYVDSTQIQREGTMVSQATIVVRIPSGAFDSILPKLRALGQVTSENTQAQDITDQFVDTEARLASDRQLETRLLQLATAREGNLDQILGVERELARVRGEIEGYQGHLKQWGDQVAMSTLTIAITTRVPEPAPEPPPPAPTLGSQTKDAFHSSVQSLRELGEWFVINGIAFLPWLVILIPGGLVARALLRRLGRRLRAMVPRAIVASEAGPGMIVHAPPATTEATPADGSR